MSSFLYHNTLLQGETTVNRNEQDVVGSQFCFSEDGEYPLLGADEAFRAWRLHDTELIASTIMDSVDCLVASKGGKWIAAKRGGSELVVWDAKTYEEVFSHEENEGENIHAVDFSPDSSRLVSATSNGIVTIWDLVTCKQVQILLHKPFVFAVKYSPQGDRIATASSSVRIWDSNNGNLLVDIPVKVTPVYNTGLLWFNTRIFVVSKDRIKEFDTFTGSMVTELLVPNSNRYSCIALPKRGKFIAYSTGRTIAFWDTSTHSQLGLIQCPQDVRSVAISPDDQFIAICGEDRKISLSRVTVSMMSCRTM